MRESRYLVSSEQELAQLAARLAVDWRLAGLERLTIGLRGELGAGKTVWARALLRALGHQGRVPSPTYTLVETYSVPPLTVVHADLYRLAEARELDMLGLREWLDAPSAWILVEWPERAPDLAGWLDVSIEFAIVGPTSRRVVLAAQSAMGRRALGLRLAEDP